MYLEQGNRPQGKRRMPTKKDSRDLITESVEDAQSLKELALDAAKNQLIESMTPQLRKFVDSQLRQTLKNEDVDRLRRGVQDNAAGESHTGFEESKDKKGKGEYAMGDKKDDGQELDLESLGSFFPSLGEAEETEGDDLGEGAVDESGIANLGEGDDGCGDDGEKLKEKKGGDDDETVDEEIEIAESEIRKVYEASLKTEATVSKNFGDMTKSGELDEVDPAGGIAEFKSGEHEWDKETPPKKQDFTVKEAIRRGLEENKRLRESLGKAVGIIKTLGGRLHEVNLFNAKVLHVNRMLNKQRLTAEQKTVVLEKIDKAKTIKEVKMVYETILDSFKVSGALSEGRIRVQTPKANAQRVRTAGSGDPKMLRESAARAENKGSGYSRLQQLAGLIK